MWLLLIVCRIIENNQVWNYDIDEPDMKSMNKLNVGWRHLLAEQLSHHPDFPFKDEIPYGYQIQSAGYKGIQSTWTD